MKDKIINLQDGTSIYIADELDYNGRRYVYGLQYDKMTFNVTAKYYILEVIVSDNKLKLKRIEDKMLKDEIYTQFTSKQFAKILED